MFALAYFPILPVPASGLRSLLYLDIVAKLCACMSTAMQQMSKSVAGLWSPPEVSQAGGL